MTIEVVKYAPKAVIEALDSIKNNEDLNNLTPKGFFEYIYTIREFELLRDWVLDSSKLMVSEKQLALLNHYLGIERLQPECEPRWYVQDNVHGNTYWELDCNNHPAEWGFNAHGQPTYENGMTEKQARGYAELFGGEAKEIK